VSRTEYADLFAVIGTSYGDGDGSNTFNLPDLLIRIPVVISAEPEFDELGKIIISDIDKEYFSFINGDEEPSLRAQRS
jgi:microcystin-dependent protein